MPSDRADTPERRREARATLMGMAAFGAFTTDEKESLWAAVDVIEAHEHAPGLNHNGDPARSREATG